jgi:hypothetical protein
VFLSYALGALVLIFVLLRQVRVRPVPRVFQARLPIVIGVIGILEMASFAGDHHVTGAAWAWVLGTMAVGAVGLGALRGLTMRVWTANNWVVRQGNAATMALWLVSLVVHFAGDAAGSNSGAAGLQGSSFLVYLGLTLAMQSYVVHRRALPLWGELGPDAGRPLQFTMSRSPGAMFTVFRTGGNPPAGWGDDRNGAPYHDDDVIDAEVVEDDDHGPPELHAPG